MHLHVNKTGEDHCHWTAHPILRESAQGLPVTTVTLFPLRTERTFFSLNVRMTLFVRPACWLAGRESLCHGVITKHHKWLTWLQALHMTVTCWMGVTSSTPPPPPPPPAPPPPPPYTTSSCLLRLMNVCLELYANDGGCRLLLLYRFSANMEILNSLLWSCLSTWHCSFECNPTRMNTNSSPPPIPTGPPALSLNPPRPFLKLSGFVCVQVLLSDKFSLWDTTNEEAPTVLMISIWDQS